MDSLKIMRKNLGCLDITVSEQKDMNAEERRQYCAAIHAVYPRIEKDLRKFIFDQLMFQGKEAENWDQILFSRGVIDGFAMLLENWGRASNEHLTNFKAESFDKFKVLPEV